MTTPGGELIGEAHIEVDANTDPAVRALRRFSREASTGLRENNRLGTSLRTLFSATGPLVGVLGRSAAGIGAIGAAAGTAGPLLAGVVTALESIAPAGAVAATGLVAVGAAAGVIKLSMVGVGDAVTAAFDTSEAGTKKFDAALKKLGPQARNFALTVRGLAPEFTKFQRSIQDVVFTGLSEQLGKLNASVLPVLRTNLTDTARTLNGVARSVATAAGTLATNGTLGKALDGANAGLKNLSGLPALAVTGFGQLAAAAAPAFDRITAAAAKAGTGIADKLSKAFESGGLTDAINQAIDVLSGLGRIAGNVFGIIGNITKSAGEGGAGLFTVLEQVTKSLKDATATKGFQDAMKALSETMSVVGGVLGGVLGDLLGVLGPLFVKLAKPVQSLAQTLGIALQPVLTSLAETFAVLGTTLGPLLESALTVLAPVLTSLAGPLQTLIVALGKGLQPIVIALGPVLIAAAGAVGALVKAVAPLLPVVGGLIAAVLPALAPLLGTLTRTFTMLAPVVAQVGQTLAAVLAPVIAALPEILQPLVDNIVAVSTAILPLVSTLLTALTPALVSLAQSAAALAVALAPLLTLVSGLAARILVMLTPLLVPLIGLLGRLASAFAMVLGGAIRNVVVPAVTVISALFRGDFSAAGRAVVGVVSGIGKQFALVFGAVKTAVSTAIDSVVKVLGKLGGRAVEAFGDIGSTLYGSGRSLIQGFIDGITSMLTSAKNAASSVVDAVGDFFPGSPAKEGRFSGRGWTVYSGQSISEGLAEGIRDRQNAAVRAASSFTGAVAASLPVGVTGAAAPLPVGAVRTPAASGPQTVVINVSLTNRGVLGDRRDVEDWLQVGLETLRRQRRLPFATT